MDKVMGILKEWYEARVALKAIEDIPLGEYQATATAPTRQDAWIDKRLDVKECEDRLFAAYAEHEGG